MVNMTPIESFEATPFVPDLHGTGNPLSSLHNSFESSLISAADALDIPSSSINQNSLLFSGIVNSWPRYDMLPLASNEIGVMLDGTVNSEGVQTLGLNTLYKWKRNPEFYDMNTRQQAGYAAEIISSAKENLAAIANGSDIRTYRADDRPNLGFKKNDPYVDKVRVDGTNKIVEKIQTKFVGDNGTEWVQKMMSKDFDKFFDGTVDKIECPKDYFDEAKARIAQEKESLSRQLEHLSANGNTDAAEKKQYKLDKYNQLDDLIEQSTVTMDEARYARNHPKRYAALAFLDDVLPDSVKEGAYGAAAAAGLTFVSSTAIHGAELIDGKITADEMLRAVATETGTAGAIGGATGFVSSAAATMMQSSSCNLIRAVGGSCLPASAVSFTVESYDSVMDYAQGAIGADELAHDLGLNAATIFGGAVGGTKAGAVAGSVFGPAGTVIGGLAGGLVGSAVAGGAYETAVQYAPEAAQGLADQAGTYAQQAMDVISSEFPNQVANAKAAFNDFFASHNMPVSL